MIEQKSSNRYNGGLALTCWSPPFRAEAGRDASNSGEFVDITEDVKNALIRAGAITDPGSTKGTLLSIAAHLFREQGFERTTVRDIGKKAGILPGSIFHHFGCKDEILRTVMRESVVLNLARIRATLPLAASTQEKLRCLIRWELHANHGETGEAWTVMINEWRSLSGEGQGEILALRKEYEDIWLEVIQEARAQDLLALDPTILRRLVAGALHWTSVWFRPDQGLNLDQLTDEVLKLILSAAPASA